MSLPRQVLPGQFCLVTRRCVQRQFLLRPDAETNNAFTYCLIGPEPCPRFVWDGRISAGGGWVGSPACPAIVRNSDSPDRRGRRSDNRAA